MDVLESRRWQLVSKDSNLDLAEIAGSIDCSLPIRCTLTRANRSCWKPSSGKSITIEHPREDINIKHEVRQWARILTACCFVEKSRDRSTAMKEKALETELYNLLSRLFPKNR